MSKNNHNEETIVEIKKTLTIEDVEENGNLPAGWLDKKKVNKPSKNSSLNQRLSSIDKSPLKARTVAFPSQHELPQTDAHFKFKGKQKRTNKFASVQVNPTANSIQNQWLEDKENNPTQPTTSIQPKPGWDSRDRIRAVAGPTLAQ